MSIFVFAVVAVVFAGLWWGAAKKGYPMASRGFLLLGALCMLASVFKFTSWLMA